jgi:hypothetical protein
VQFYSIYIHNFELCVTPLRKLTSNNKYTSPIALNLSNAAQQALNDLNEAILAGPFLMQFNHKCLIVLQTNFLSKGFGYVVCQPGADAASKQVMAACQAEKDFAFMTKDSSAVLRLVTFGGRPCCDIKIYLHSLLGEGFAGD